MGLMEKRVDLPVTLVVVIVSFYLCLPVPSRCQNDENFCIGEQCSNNGSCREFEAGFECDCTQDYTGVTCDTSLNQSCSSGLCQNGGTCSDINRTLSTGVVDSFNCTCADGYEGPLCERPVDHCLTLPCGANGNCTSLPEANNFTCACEAGFTGSNCETNINDCANSAVCQNGGTCQDGVNSFTCNCTESWTGQYCTDDVNECDLNICQHGTCQNTQGSYICNCNNTGYEGENCETQVNECETGSPCKNGGTCTDTEGSYNCSCTLGYEGQDCEIPNCDAGQCLNGATCQVDADKWKCNCVQYYEGDQCEIAGPCLNQTCNTSNTAECVQDVVQGNYTCVCDKGWEGEDCSVNINECNDNNGGCENGANCLDTPGSFVCICQPGYTGQLCKVDIDDCADPSLCLNGAQCIDLVNNYTCNCTQGYEGFSCSEDIDECETGVAQCPPNTQCVNKDGYYNCTCKEGFIGINCVEDPCRNTICEHGGSCNSSLTDGGDYTATCYCSEGYEGSRCEKLGAVEGEPLNLWYIIGPVIAVVLLIIIIGIVVFVMMARTKRATRGTYSPSRQETSGARVELGNVLKKPPEERLI